jgi:hypothetical protein
MQNIIRTKLAADGAQRGALSSSSGDRADLRDHRANCRHRGARRALRDRVGAACARREGLEVRADERVPSAVVVAFRPVSGGISSTCNRYFNPNSEHRNFLSCRLSQAPVTAALDF